MRRLGFLFGVLGIALVACATGKKTRYVEYKVTDMTHIEDSIKDSGTTMGEWKEWVFSLEEEGMDPLRFTTLYDKKGNATGTIQVREKGDTLIVKIIDYNKLEDK